MFGKKKEDENTAAMSDKSAAAKAGNTDDAGSAPPLKPFSKKGSHESLFLKKASMVVLNLRRLYCPPWQQLTYQTLQRCFHLLFSYQTYASIPKSDGARTHYLIIL